MDSTLAKAGPSRGKPAAKGLAGLPIGEILVAQGVVSPERVAEALAAQAERGGRLGEVLVSLKACSEEQVLKALAAQLELPYQMRLAPDEVGYQANIDYSKKPGPLSRMRRGVRDELNKVENGGPGSSNERVIGPAPRYIPPQMDKPGLVPSAPPSPAPLPLEPSKDTAPGTQTPAPPPPPTDEKRAPNG